MRGRRGRRGEQPMVPAATFDSYYGKPVLNSPVWEPRDIAGYLFLGGLAGASSALGRVRTQPAGPRWPGRARWGPRRRAWSRWPPSSTIWAAQPIPATCCGCSR